MKIERAYPLLFSVRARIALTKTMHVAQRISRTLALRWRFRGNTHGASAILSAHKGAGVSPHNSVLTVTTHDS